MAQKLKEQTSMLILLIWFVSAIELCTLEKIQVEESAIRRSIQNLSKGLRFLPLNIGAEDINDSVRALEEDFDSNVDENQLGEHFSQIECNRRLQVLSVYQYKAEKLADVIDQF